MLPSRQIYDDRGEVRTYLADKHPDEDARAVAREHERREAEAAQMGPHEPRASKGLADSARGLGFKLRHFKFTGGKLSFPHLSTVAGLVLAPFAVLCFLLVGAALMALVLGSLAICGVVSFLAAQDTTTGMIAGYVSIVALSLCVLASSIPKIRSGPARQSFPLIQSRLERDCCPCCAYPYSDAPPEADGCRVCSECGAAWQPPKDEDFEDDTFVNEEGLSLRDVEEQGPHALPDYGPPKPPYICEVRDMRGVGVRILPQRVAAPYTKRAFGLLGCRPRTRWLVLTALLVCAACLAASRFFAWRSPRVPPDPRVLLPGAIVVAAVLCLFAARRVARNLHAEKQVKTWLREGRCLACEGELRRAGELQKCDACGAVWSA